MYDSQNELLNLRRFWLAIVLAVLFPAPFLHAQQAFDEMLGRYILIYDSTSIWPDGSGGYDYKRKFISEVVLDEEGRSVLSRPATPILSKDDKIDISAYTRLPSGEIMHADTSDMTTRILPGDRRWIFVNFRHTEPGAVLHLEWQISSTEAIIAGKRFLGRTVPVGQARIIITVPEPWVFNFALSPNINTESRAEVNPNPNEGPSIINYIWVANNLPGMNKEEFSPPVERLIPCLYFSFYYEGGGAGQDKGRIDWAYLSDLYNQQFRNFKRANSSLNSVADSLNDIEDRAGKLASMAYDWLAQHFKPSESEITFSGGINGALQRGRGTQAEASAILSALFEKLNIYSTPYLVATRDAGEPLYNLPALFWFDRVLLNAVIGPDTFWIDPYYPLIKLGVMPFEDQGAMALNFSQNANFTIVPISDYHDNAKAIHLKLEFDSTGSLHGEATEVYSGAMIPEISSFLQNLDELEKPAPWEKKLAKSLPSAKIQKFVIMPPDSLSQAFRIGYTFTTGPLVRPFANRIYIPMDLLGRWADLPVLPAATRHFPIELRRARFELERISLKISSAFEVDFLPSNYGENNEIGDIYSVVGGDRNSITLTRGLGIKKPSLPISEYNSLCKFLIRARAEADKQIILKRVE